MVAVTLALSTARCFHRRHSAASLMARSSSLIIDTDCALDDIATIAAASAVGAPLRLVTTTSGLAPPGEGHIIARRVMDAVDMGSVRVVAGAEAPPPHVTRQKDAWEHGYSERLSSCLKLAGIDVAYTEAAPSGSAAAAADAIVDVARAAGGGTTILALGALTNLAAACERHPADFSRHVERIIFIGDAQSRRSFNIECDPAALGTVLRSGVDLVLVGAQCYPSPEWVSELFAGGASAAGAAPNPAAARVLRAFGEHDPYAFCYDPLALLYHLQPEAFGVAVSAPVRLTDDGCLEGCDEARATGRAAEPVSVSLDAYAAFLRQVSGL